MLGFHESHKTFLFALIEADNLRNHVCFFRGNATFPVQGFAQTGGRETKVTSKSSKGVLGISTATLSKLTHKELSVIERHRGNLELMTLDVKFNGMPVP